MSEFRIRPCVSPRFEKKKSIKSGEHGFPSLHFRSMRRLISTVYVGKQWLSDFSFSMLLVSTPSIDLLFHEQTGTKALVTSYEMTTVDWLTPPT